MKLKVGDFIVATSSSGEVTKGEVLIVKEICVHSEYELRIVRAGTSAELVWKTYLSAPCKKLHKYLYGVENGET
jgi:hypothetical protein